MYERSMLREYWSMAGDGGGVFESEESTQELKNMKIAMWE